MRREKTYQSGQKGRNSKK